MSDATDESGWVYGEWDRSQLAQHTIEEKAEYVRADLHDALAAKCESLERERDALDRGLSQAMSDTEAAMRTLWETAARRIAEVEHSFHEGHGQREAHLKRDTPMTPKMETIIAPAH